MTRGQVDSLFEGWLDLDSARVPTWHATAARVVAAVLAGATASEPVTGIEQESPAGVFLAPFFAFADEQFAGSIVREKFRLSPGAWAALRRCLADRLLKVCEKTLALERDVFLAIRGSEAQGRARLRTRRCARIRSVAAQGGALALLERFPVVARLGAIAIDRWVTTSRDFLARLERDRDAMAVHFGSSAGRVEAIEHDRSDLHNGHQCVIKVTFETGLTVYYKPRPGECEAAFSGMVDWINQSRPPAPLAAMDVLDRGDYCWVREITHAPCVGANDGAVYHRAGMLLALMYALQGRDMHNENIIASGAMPYLIDVESLLEPEFALADPTTSADLGLVREPSVFDIGLLPACFPTRLARRLTSAASVGWPILRTSTGTTKTTQSCHLTGQSPTAFRSIRPAMSKTLSRGSARCTAVCLPVRANWRCRQRARRLPRLRRADDLPPHDELCGADRPVALAEAHAKRRGSKRRAARSRQAAGRC